MGGIIDKITDFIKEMLQGWVLDNLATMFTDVNDKVGTIAGEVSTTPSAWNSGIFNMIKTLSENVVIPIAGLIISFVLIYELITMVIDKNNMHDFDTSLFFRFLFKACTNTNETQVSRKPSCTWVSGLFSILQPHLVD